MVMEKALPHLPEELVKLAINKYFITIQKLTWKISIQIKKDIEKSEELLNDFGLGDADIDSIFDIIAKEHPEI